MEHNKNNRPQEPQQPYPYREEEVSYENAVDQVVLSGTLTLPNKPGIFPAVVLIAGYGPNNRNASGMGHKYFLVLADYLTRSDIAVLRFDKRGVGTSTGDWATSNSEDLARDVLAGIEYLKTRSDINHKAIGLTGLSEGGLIATLVAAQSTDLSCIVLMAPALATTIEDMLYHTALQLRADGASDEFIRRDQEVRRTVCEIAQNENDRDKAQAMMKTTIKDYLKALPESQTLEAEKLPFAFTEAKVDDLVKVLTSPAYQFFLHHDSSKILQRVTVPTLTIIGDRDYITSAARIFSVIEKTCSKYGSKNFTMMELHNLNHMFQSCKTGSLAEYGAIEETMSPAAMKLIKDWLLKHMAV